MVELRDVCKRFGQRAALTDVTLSVESGERATLVGPNGAGKTTLLRVAATLTRPTSGTVRVNGLDPSCDGHEARRRIGFLSHQTLLYDDLTATQNLRYYARLYGVDDDPDRISALLKRTGLSPRSKDLVRTFSRGLKQRLAIARAVLHRPRVLLLDEPFTGLDTQAAETLSDLVSEMAGEGRTILMATHNLERALMVGQRVVVLNHGRIVHDVQRDGLDADAFPALYRTLTSKVEIRVEGCRL